MFKNILNVTLSIVAVVCIIGCSNQDPISVNTNDNAPSKSAALSSVPMRDIAVWGNDIWGLTTYEVASAPGNYYIFKFNTSTNNWDATYHYAKKISVSTDGKCYHFNSNNDIWVAESPTYGYPFAAPPMAGNITDISAGVLTGGTHSVWIAINNRIFQWYHIPSGYGWVERTSGHSGTTTALGCDPLGGEACATSGSGRVQYYSNGTWSSQSNSYTYATDVAIAGAWILFMKYGRLYKMYRNNRSTLVSSGVGSQGVAGDYDYYYYITSFQAVYRGPNTWN